MKGFKSFAELVESAKYIAALYKKILACGKKIDGYEVHSFYPSNSPRQAWLMKRNDTINEALVEAQKWVYLTGANVPCQVRPWQENVKVQQEFLLNFTNSAFKNLVELQKKNG